MKEMASIMDPTGNVPGDTGVGRLQRRGALGLVDSLLAEDRNIAGHRQRCMAGRGFVHRVAEQKVPDLIALNRELEKRTGWNAVGVSGFIPAPEFFRMLSRTAVPDDCDGQKPRWPRLCAGARHLSRCLRTCASSRPPDICRLSSAIRTAGLEVAKHRRVGTDGAAVLVHRGVRPDS